MRIHIFVENGDEFRDDAIAFEGGEQASIHINRSLRLFERARQGYSDVGVLGFAGAVDYATHDGELHFFHTYIAAFPGGHLLAKVGLNLLGHFLEKGAGGASASGARSDLRGEAANPQGVRNLLAHGDFFGAIGTGRRSQRDSDDSANAFLHDHTHASPRSDHALVAHASFGKAKVQRVVATRGKSAVNVDQILHTADFRAENDLVWAQAEFLCQV